MTLVREEMHNALENAPNKGGMMARFKYFLDNAMPNEMVHISGNRIMVSAVLQGKYVGLITCGWVNTHTGVKYRGYDIMQKVAERIGQMANTGQFNQSIASAIFSIQ